MKDLIERQAAIDAMEQAKEQYFDRRLIIGKMQDIVNNLPSAEPEEVIPHRNYKYLSDFWCECGWHLGKKGAVKYCAECGKKVKWDG